MRGQQRRTGNRVFLLPALVVMAVVALYTTGYSVYLALRDISLISPPPYDFVGLENFRQAFTEARALAGFRRSVIYVVAAVVTELGLGLAIALYLQREFFGRKLVRALLLIPMIMTPVVVGLIWRIFYDPNAGIINYLLRGTPLRNADWLGSPQLAMGAVVVADIWQWTPFVILIVMAALDAMSTEPVEAARIDGANAFQIFRHIVFPLLRPALVIAGLLRLIDSFKVFDLIYVMTRGGPALATETVNMFAYIEGFSNFNISYAVTLSLVMTLITSFALTWIYQRTRSQG